MNVGRSVTKMNLESQKERRKDVRVGLGNGRLHVFAGRMVKCSLT